MLSYTYRICTPALHIIIFSSLFIRLSVSDLELVLCCGEHSRLSVPSAAVSRPGSGSGAVCTTGPPGLTHGQTSGSG